MTDIQAAADRLANLTGVGSTGIWRQIISAADGHLLRALDSTMGDGSSDRDRLIRHAAEDGYDWRDDHFSKTGRLKPSASRFIHHLLATIDITMQAQGKWNGEYRADYCLPIRNSYRAMRTMYARKSGPLTEYEVRIARTRCLASALKLDLYIDDVEYFAKHYDDFEPYLDVIIARKTMYHRDLESLLETLPQPALADGTL